jgi:hypothetical protein
MPPLFLPTAINSNCFTTVSVVRYNQYDYANRVRPFPYKDNQATSPMSNCDQLRRQAEQLLVAMPLSESNESSKTQATRRWR